jgi:hypothetical protein
MNFYRYVHMYVYVYDVMHHHNCIDCGIIRIYPIYSLALCVRVTVFDQVCVWAVVVVVGGGGGRSMRGTSVKS